MEQILLTYNLPKETVAAKRMLYENSKVKVRSPDGDTDYFNIVAGVLQRDTLALYLFIICLDYVLRTSIDLMKENGFKLTKERKKKYPAQTITGTAYADDIALLVTCKSNLTDEIKRSFFQAAVIPILLYGCTIWTLTKRMEKKLSGNYTRIL